MSAIDILVEYFKLDPPAKTRMHQWRDGERPQLFRDDEQAA